MFVLLLFEAVECVGSGCNESSLSGSSALNAVACKVRVPKLLFSKRFITVRTRGIQDKYVGSCMLFCIGENTPSVFKCIVTWN